MNNEKGFSKYAVILWSKHLNSRVAGLAKKVDLLRQGPLSAIFVVTHPDGLYVWKKVARDTKPSTSIRLWLPPGTIFHFGINTSHKCRASVAVSLNRLRGCYSGHDGSSYDEYEIKLPEKDFCNGFSICASGIHFFLNRIDAIDYTL